ncbi:Protein of unknown function (DUF2523) [Beggiatoa alba B18LD]|uniref:DUF2523 domain-containing protein n=1 Tax=Beggiatoa alba B18LD TaxID=395493 RepID=I3CK67_9GAMM|nr:DUF2523 family protein [Beggiatoa alba]EIJ44010.1 Protein of unknown function (DUF2523) [Beggiatoa alba B18LD]
MSELLAALFNKLFTVKLWEGLFNFFIMRFFTVFGLSIATYKGFNALSDMVMDKINLALNQLDNAGLLISMAAMLDYLGVMTNLALISSAYVVKSAYKWSIVKNPTSPTP